MAEKIKGNENQKPKKVVDEWAEEIKDQYSLIYDAERDIFIKRENYEKVISELKKKYNLNSLKDEELKEQILLKLKTDTINICGKIETDSKKKLSEFQKASIEAEKRAILENSKLELQENLKIYNTNKALFSEEIRSTEQHLENVNKALKNIAKTKSDILTPSQKKKQNEEDRKDRLAKIGEIQKERSNVAESIDHKKALKEKAAKEQIELEKKLGELDPNSEEAKHIKRQISSRKGIQTKANKKIEESESYDEILAKDESKAKTNAIFQNMADKIGEAGDKFGIKVESTAEAFKAGIKETIGSIKPHIESYWKLMDNSANTRLWGTGFGNSLQAVIKEIKYAVGLSPWVKQKDVIEKLNQAVEQGIIYNLEERAYLATISDKIAATFNAFDSSLLRIIRLQQADTTKAHMGLEATLNQFFGDTFEDTAYMNTAKKTVSDALVDAVALQERNDSLAFEYTAQKWLGSLYSVGLSDSAVQTLAKGINLLATGDVEGLAGNESLQNLYAMASSRAGLNYAEILTKGLDSSTLNTLLKSVVEYLQEITENSTNQVTMKQFANIFGMSMSDMRAISNLTTSDLSRISNETKNYNQLVGKTYEMAATVGLRTDPSTLLQNVYQNLMWSMGESIASNPATGLTFLINQVVKDATGGINIPFINAMGFGLDLNTDINSLIDLGLIGYGLLGSVGPALSGLTNVAGLAGPLATFSAFSRDYTSRGKGFSGVLSGTSSGLSLSSQIGSGSTADMESATLTSATDKAIEQTEGAAAEHENDRTAENIYQMMFEQKEPIAVKMDSSGGFNVIISDYNSKALDSLKSKFAENLTAALKYYQQHTIDNTDDNKTFEERIIEILDANNNLVPVTIRENSSDMTSAITSPFGAFMTGGR